MWTSSAPCFLKKKRKKDLKRWWYLKAEKGCERKNERGNEHLRRKSKRQVSAKRKTNISDLIKKKKKGHPNQR